MSNLGPLYIIIAAVFWSFGGLLGKLIPWSGLTIAALRGIIAAITIGLYRRSFSFKLNKPILLAGISLTITTILFMIANKMTSAANAIVLQYTSPVFIILLTLVIYKQKPKKRDMFAIFGVLVGISIFFFDQFKSGNYIGDLIALGSGLSFAAVFFANKLPNASPIDATYLGNLLSLFILPFVFFDQNFLMNQSSLTWLFIILMGVFQLGFGYIFFSLGIKHTAATTSSIIATLEPILNPIWVFVFIGEVPSLLALVGGVIVLITVSIYNVIVTRDNYKLIKSED
jgi:drug/metabolite transporter (DMT)-like permease